MNQSTTERQFLLHKLKEQNITILVSTPYMDEAMLCDRIALIQEGVFLQVDTPDNIIERFTEILWAVKSAEMFRLLNDLRQYNAIKSCFTFGEVHHITVKDNLKIDDLENYLKEKGHMDIEIYPIKPNIEDCYMQLAKNIKS